MDYIDFHSKNFNQLKLIRRYQEYKTDIVQKLLEDSKQFLTFSSNEIKRIKKEDFIKLELNENSNIEKILSKRFNSMFEFTCLFVEVYERSNSQNKSDLTKIFKEYLSFTKWFVEDFYSTYYNKNEFENFDFIISIYTNFFNNIVSLKSLENKSNEFNSFYFTIFRDSALQKALKETKYKVDTVPKFDTSSLFNKIEKLAIKFDSIIDELNLNHASNIHLKHKFIDSVDTISELKGCLNINNSKKENELMYAISNVIEKTSDKSLKEIKWKNPNVKLHKYELRNLNIYDENTGKLIQEADEIKYNTNFLLKLGNLYILDVKPFLTYQLENSKNPKALFDYIKYASQNTSIIDEKSIKEAIKDWVNENQFFDESKFTSDKNLKLSDLITHEKNMEIIEGIKVQYKNIKGKSLKLLLMAFQELNLLPKDRISKKFHDCCKNEFNWDIASYNAMNGYIYNEITDTNEFNSKKQYLEELIKTE
jgi:hypothetical protein